MNELGFLCSLQEQMIHGNSNVDGIADVLQDVHQACEALDINFFIIGGVAKNVWFAGHERYGMWTISWMAYIR